MDKSLPEKQNSKSSCQWMLFTCSSYEKVTSGIPQVSVFGPILFVIYINDLPYVIQVMMRMYADDSKILRRLNTPDHVNQVQVSVNQSVIWASIRQMFYHYKNATIYT